MDIGQFLKENLHPGQRVAVMGIGSTLRSDDGAGMHFIDCLREKVQRQDTLMIAGSTAPENFTGQIKGFQPDILFIVDAAFLGLAPGETTLIPQGEIGGLSCSTHMLPLPVLLQYLESEVSCSMVLIGIQPRDTTLGLEMCEEVRESTELLAQTFAQALRV